MIRPFVIAGVSLALLTAAGCKPKAGSACEAGKALCADEATALVCEDRKLIASPCKGPKGCRAESGVQTCDVSANQPGDACSKSDQEGNAACAADGKSMVICHAGRYRIDSCRGPEGCHEGGVKVVCDRSLATVGDACDETGGYACDVDKKSALICQGGKFVHHDDCAGGCSINGTKVQCD